MNKAKVLGFATLILLTVTALAFVDYSLQQQTDFLVGHGVYFPGYWYTQIASVNLRNTPDNMTWQVGDITIHYSYSLYFATVGPQLPLPASFVECEYGHSTNAYPCNQIVILIATSSVDNCPYPACPSLPDRKSVV